MAHSHKQEKMLIQQYNKGDTNALRQMYACYKVDLVTLATALLFNKDHAEDIVHDVFARLMDIRQKIRINTNLRGYLLRAVANMARNVNRSTTRIHPDQEKKGSSLTQVKSPEYSAILTEQCDKMLAVLPDLPYEQREVILLRHYGNLQFLEIAKCQDVSISTAQARYRYGLEKLRSLLGDDL